MNPYFKNTFSNSDDDYQYLTSDYNQNKFFDFLNTDTDDKNIDVKLNNKSNNKNRFRDNIVFDLDNTLICAVPFSQLHLLPADLPFIYHDFIIDEINNSQNLRIFARPHLHKMLLSVSQFANISVWTAAGKEYADFVVSRFFPTSIKIDFLFHSEQVQDAVRTYFRFKPLDYIYSFYPTTYSQNNTIIVDDLTDVASANPNNSIQIKAFKILTDILHTFNKSVIYDTELLTLIEELKIKFDTLLITYKIGKMGKLKN
jgi:hypothetical protein